MTPVARSESMFSLFFGTPEEPPPAEPEKPYEPPPPPGPLPFDEHPTVLNGVLTEPELVNVREKFFAKATSKRQVSCLRGVTCLNHTHFCNSTLPPDKVLKLLPASYLYSFTTPTSG